MTEVYWKNTFRDQLSGIYTIAEIDIIFGAIAEKLAIKKDKSTNSSSELSSLQQSQMKAALEELLKHKPYQYILGYTEFFGTKIQVNEHVLIPRPETEELVEWVISENQKTDLKILDIGTGSGCIAISLKKNLSSSNVYGLEISENALAVAKVNALINNVEIKFIQDDILNLSTENFPKFDLIVSNPPYIVDSELLENNVMNFEPHLALFVPENNPLLFYQKIIEFSKSNLENEGKIYVEINQNLAEETKKLFEIHFKKVELKKDISGNYRMIKAMHIKN